MQSLRCFASEFSQCSHCPQPKMLDKKIYRSFHSKASGRTMLRNYNSAVSNMPSHAKGLPGSSLPPVVLQAIWHAQPPGVREVLPPSTTAVHRGFVVGSVDHWYRDEWQVEMMSFQVCQVASCRAAQPLSQACKSTGQNSDLWPKAFLDLNHNGSLHPRLPVYACAFFY